MRHNVVTIARNTTKRMWRSKAPLGIFLLLLILLVLPLRFQGASLANGTAYFSLSTFALSMVNFCVMFLGANVVSEEIEQRTLPLVLSRPLSAWEYLAGCGLGLVLLYAQILIAVFAVLATAYVAYHPALPPGALMQWVSHLCNGVASIVTACALGALMPRFWALTVQSFGSALGVGLPMLLLGHAYAPFNAIAELAFYLGPLYSPVAAMAQAQQTSALTAAPIVWFVASALDDLGYAAAIVYGLAWLFAKRA